MGETLYLVDYTTVDLVKKITLDVPETVSYLGGMRLSKERNFLVFGAIGQFPDPEFGFALYNIQKESIQNVFMTDTHGYGSAYFIAARKTDEPGLFYVHFRDLGTYAIDVFEQRIVGMISDEHDFDLGKRIYHSPDGQWTVVKKDRNDEAYTELEFYPLNSDLQDASFVLNQGNRDSIAIYDFEFSDDQTLYITFQLSGGRSRRVASYFGRYNLKTQTLSRSSITFPWSLNPYYTAYSPTRDEVYTVGASDTLYVIDADAYKITEKIPLTGKITGPSRILLSPGEEIAFISCSNTDAIYVIDLNEKTVLKVIKVIHPYNMIIP